MLLYNNAVRLSTFKKFLQSKRRDVLNTDNRYGECWKDCVCHNAVGTFWPRLLREVGSLDLICSHFWIAIRTSQILLWDYHNRVPDTIRPTVGSNWCCGLSCVNIRSSGLMVSADPRKCSQSCRERDSLLWYSESKLGCSIPLSRS